jgi:hypothetical protein
VDRAEGPTGFFGEKKWKSEIGVLDTCPRSENLDLENIVASVEEPNYIERNSTGEWKI